MYVYFQTKKIAWMLQKITLLYMKLLFVKQPDVSSNWATSNSMLLLDIEESFAECNIFDCGTLNHRLIITKSLQFKLKPMDRVQRMLHTFVVLMVLLGGICIYLHPFETNRMCILIPCYFLGSLCSSWLSITLACVVLKELISAELC